ncbi:hypothetical protein RFF05_00925 [Bengtsoniella intestinalis]|uniref:hypothetical protein n=1 Tax=Bengtsoniella intestinalis TaxID=3073143 RepID=UPI00391F0997
MDKVALLRDGKTVGEMTIAPEGLYTVFHACVFALEDAVQAVYLVGETGEIRLGVLEKKGLGGDIVRRLSNQSYRPIGKVKHGAVRLAQDSPWQPLGQGQCPYLKGQKVGDGWWKPWGGGVKIAVPYSPSKPYPLMRFFCFAQMEQIEKTPYLVVALSEQEHPVV